MSRRNSVQMLRQLPGVFDISDMAAVLGLTHKDATQYCWRWNRDELIKRIGGRTGVFYNLIVEANFETLISDAVRKALGDRPTILIGASALNSAGWTTQMPRQYELAVLTTRIIRTTPQIDGVSFAPRSERWFSLVDGHTSMDLNGFNCLSPEYALVDSLLVRRTPRLSGWTPDADDIDPFDVDVEASLVKLMEAAHDLKVPESEVEDYISQIPCFNAGSHLRPGR